MNIVEHKVRLRRRVASNPDAFEPVLSTASAIILRDNPQRENNQNLTSLYSFQRNGPLKYPRLNIRNRRNGVATSLAKNTLPTLAGISENAYRTQRTTRSSKNVALCTNGRRLPPPKYLSRTIAKGKFTMHHSPSATHLRDTTSSPTSSPSRGK